VRRLAVLLAVAACGKDAGSTGPDAPPSQDGETGFAACTEFAAAPVVVPAMVTGAVEGADVASPLECAQVDAPYGAESAGPDRVIPLSGLRVGMPYMVKLTSSDDLAFYVVTGCSTEAGPASDQCLVFEDASFAGVEAARFVATDVSAFVVVDFYASHDPESSQFELEIYSEECAGASECSSATPACVHGRCVECETSFDCDNVANGRCDDTTYTCEPGEDACAADDAGEPANDGPSGARVLMPDYTGVATATGKICASPFSEDDFFAFDVETAGETWALSLDWIGTRDIDLKIYDATGNVFGLSFWDHAERTKLTYLPVGRYYVEIDEFATDPIATPIDYTLTAQRTTGPGCTSANDCAAEYRNQLFRGECSAGACIDIAGNGAVTEGGACDSESDCLPELACPSFFFTADSDTRERCAPICGSDAECPTDQVCTTYFSENFCVARCTTDLHCPISLIDAPEAPPWFRLSCDVPSGRCM